MSFKEIARQANVSRKYVRDYVRVINYEINPATDEPFRSVYELDKYRIRQRINPETGQQFQSLADYNNHTARNRTNPTTGQPFASDAEYRHYFADQRSSTKYTRALGRLIKQRLTDLGHNQTWLARELSVSRESVSKYAAGKRVPYQGRLEELFGILAVPYRTLDELFDSEKWP